MKERAMSFDIRAACDKIIYETGQMAGSRNMARAVDRRRRL